MKKIHTGFSMDNFSAVTEGSIDENVAIVGGDEYGRHSSTLDVCQRERRIESEATNIGGENSSLGERAQKLSQVKIIHSVWLHTYFSWSLF